MKFYATSIRPVLTYACDVYNFNLQEKQKSSLERIQIKSNEDYLCGFDKPFDVVQESPNLVKLSTYRYKLCDDFPLKISHHTKDKIFKHWLLIRTQSYHLQET